VAVIIENGEHGSTTAAPVARKVMDAYLLPRDDAQGPASPAPVAPVATATAVSADAAPPAQDPVAVAIPAAPAGSAPEDHL
jgi:penicillin-binding protein 2